jgi:hypothetical protein
MGTPGKQGKHESVLMLDLTRKRSMNVHLFLKGCESLIFESGSHKVFETSGTQNTANLEHCPSKPCMPCMPSAADLTTTCDPPDPRQVLFLLCRTCPMCFLGTVLAVVIASRSLLLQQILRYQFWFSDASHRLRNSNWACLAHHPHVVDPPELT